MRLSDRVENMIVQALRKVFPEPETLPPPDHEFFIINTPNAGLRAMVALIVPVSDEDNTAQFDDIDPYASVAEFEALITRLYGAAQLARSGIVLSGQPGVTRSSKSGLVLPG